MANYTYPQSGITFGGRDALAPGDTQKTIKGVQLDPEFEELAARSADKLNTLNPSFTGVMTGGGTVDGGTF